MSYGVDCRLDLDAVLCLWHRPGAPALIPPLAWKPPCAVGAALKSKNKNKNKKKKKREKDREKEEWLLREGGWVW